MIPKIIHYCWFGNSPINELAKDCLKSWEKHLPDYEIKLWNENNFNIGISKFSKEAYACKNFAHVSDYARFWIIKNYGGIYLDIDYEVLKPFPQNILEHSSFLGLDEIGDVTAIIGSVPNHPFVNEMVEKYDSLAFKNEDGTKNDETMNIWMQEILLKYGYKKENINQKIREDIHLYRDDFFQAKSLITGKINKTDNTITIHHHSLTWVSKTTRVKKFLRIKVLIPLLGSKNYLKLTSLFNKK